MQKETNEWTIASTLSWTSNYFARSRIARPRLEAELLLSHALHLPRLELTLKLNEVIPPKDLHRYRSLISARKSRKPIAYILGEQEFMGMRFRVNEHTLIPRPETEHLVEETLQLIKGKTGLLLADIGTGCGNIAVSLAKSTAGCRVYATDISREALAVTHENISAHGCAAQVLTKLGDLFAALSQEHVHNKLDIIISNPPYIALDEEPSLEPEVLCEPRHALFGGADGLDFYRRIAREGKPFLKNDGVMALEMHSGKSGLIGGIFLGEGFEIIKITKDYAGLDRVIIVKAIHHG